MSPFNNFMAASGYHNQKANTYGWGVMGGVTEIPQAFTLTTMMYYGSKGVAKVIFLFLILTYIKIPYYF